MKKEKEKRCGNCHHFVPRQPPLGICYQDNAMAIRNEWGGSECTEHKPTDRNDC